MSTFVDTPEGRAELANRVTSCLQDLVTACSMSRNLSFCHENIRYYIAYAAPKELSPGIKSALDGRTHSPARLCLKMTSLPIAEVEEAESAWASLRGEE